MPLNQGSEGGLVSLGEKSFQELAVGLVLSLVRAAPGAPAQLPRWFGCSPCASHGVPWVPFPLIIQWRGRGDLIRDFHRSYFLPTQ
jgi:hypothetical protein